MIPPKSDPCWRDLMNGTIKHDFKLVSAGMCLSRNRRNYKLNPTEHNFEQAVEELHAFFTKYESLLNEDLPHIFLNRR